MPEGALSVRPKGLPAIIGVDWIEQGMATVVRAKARKDYASADFIKRVVSEFVEIQEQADGTILWSWRPLTPESRYWDA